ELITTLAATRRPEAREILSAIARRWIWWWQGNDRKVRTLAREALSTAGVAPARPAPGPPAPPAPGPPAPPDVPARSGEQKSPGAGGSAPPPAPLVHRGQGLAVPRRPEAPDHLVATELAAGDHRGQGVVDGRLVRPALGPGEDGRPDRSR